MNLVSRYVFREACIASLLVVAVLLVIFMSNQFAEILGDAATNALPKDAVFEVFRLTFLRYLTFLAPIGLLLGLMLGLARLNRDGEMAAIAACGIGPGKLLQPIAVITVVAAAGIAWLSLVETPQANRRIEEIRFAARETMDFTALEPGRFTMLDSGRTVLYAREVEGNQLRGVFIEREEDGRVTVVTAERGERVQERGRGELTIRLYDGRRTEGTPGQSEFWIAGFGEHGIPIRFDDPEAFVETAAIKETRTLLASSDAMDRAELHWRIAAPLSMLVLALLALPLSRSSPREGRFARVGMALLIYLIYANALSIARIWLERGVVPEWLGMWWVHGALGVAAGTLLLQASGTLRRPRAFVYDSRTRHEPAA